MLWPQLWFLVGFLRSTPLEKDSHVSDLVRKYAQTDGRWRGRSRAEKVRRPGKVISGGVLWKVALP